MSAKIYEFTKLINRDQHIVEIKFRGKYTRNLYNTEQVNNTQDFLTG